MKSTSLANWPIFIVGVPRSGTTLLAAMLRAHSRMSCGPETQIFGKRVSSQYLPNGSNLTRREQLIELCSERHWHMGAANHLASIENMGVSLLELYDLKREDIVTFLNEHAPSVPALLASITEVHMRKNGKKRWIEKSPNHLAFVDDLRFFFPHSPILRIVRDPRDVALSLLKVPWGQSSFEKGILLWLRFDDDSRAFFSLDKNTHTVRFEDLIRSPEEELKKTCLMLQESFEPGMLDISEAAKHVRRLKTNWSPKVGKPLDQDRLRVWERELSADQKKIALSVLGGKLFDYGYLDSEEMRRVAEEFPTYVTAFPMSAFGNHPKALEQCVSNGCRFWPKYAGERAKLKLFIGDPIEESWFGDTSSQRLRCTLQLCADIVKATWKRSPVLWIANPLSDNPCGVCLRLLTCTLNHLRSSHTDQRIHRRFPWVLNLS